VVVYGTVVVGIVEATTLAGEATTLAGLAITLAGEAITLAGDAVTTELPITLVGVP
jgi:hypothetical protein